MITKEQLLSIDFRSIDGTLYHDYYRFDFEYNIKSQDLYEFNEVNGKTNYLCRVIDFEQLKELTDSVNR